MVYSKRRIHPSAQYTQADEGRWQNDIKEATVKCKAEYGITQSVYNTKLRVGPSGGG